LKFSGQKSEKSEISELGYPEMDYPVFCIIHVIRL